VKNPNPTIRFQSDPKLREHVIYHVLSPNESHAWYVIWNQRDDLLSPTEEGLDAAYKARKKLQASTDNTTEGDFAWLLAKYVDEIDRQFGFSEKIGWVWREQSVQAGLGIDGVFYVLKGYGDSRRAVTAFVPGFGTSAQTLESQTDCDNPHSRVVKSMARESWQERKQFVCKSIQQRMKEHRLRNDSNDELIYYVVIRPTLQFLRSYQGSKDPSHTALARVRDILPRNGQLKFESWLELKTKESERHG
jgi:hypothetical protein